MFDAYLRAWELIPDGAPIITRASHLLPVRQRGVAAMLKIADHDDERIGGAVMQWWNGEGAARVLARDDIAVLLERAEGSQSLALMARTRRDDEATKILCDVAARLHSPRSYPPPGLITLSQWFRDLGPAAAKHGGILVKSAEAARMLLAEPRDVCVLHGDLHHNNVLDFGARGWLAIDPKHLTGERAFDYANIFTNPDLDHPQWPIATIPERFARRLEIVTKAAKVERARMLRWILAWTGLSAAWYLDDGDPAEVDLRVAELASAELNR
ncbi:MAG: APH(6) family putative aminoglycoside O-phosphotransferase [Afipia sp.]|jgi:streptomycin 6-kinase|nr:APH(6) family putative aminoglycoside O-phosphotransferase [Afipia sp.]MBS4006307.1 APH(6) family putative aminoglycoside O-phosphotransferase [Afipia sp.]WIG50210.1 MAG: Aminoglycoside 6-phosphotransferase, putative [Afipia sp.]